MTNFNIKNLGDILKFHNEDDEREFWAKNDSTEYIEWHKAKKVSFPNLKPSTKIISVSLPESLLNDLKIIANKRDVPYQSFIKMIPKERIDAETKSV